MGDTVVPQTEASLNIASAAVLYGLSVYTVFPVRKLDSGLAAFRIKDHWQRLVNSARIIGLDVPEGWDLERFEDAARNVVTANELDEHAFVRASIHAAEELPGVRTRGVGTAVSMFVYEPLCILPSGGARLKTSVWRRTPDVSIPSRAKVNGGYVNSALARQDALDSGYDDCVFLDTQGHVCELSAANLFIVRDGILHTPDRASDILEGVSRRTMLELAQEAGVETRERTIDLTELYIADEVFACGTSAYLTPIIEVDKRRIGKGEPGTITETLRERYTKLISGQLPEYAHYFTEL